MRPYMKETVLYIAGIAVAFAGYEALKLVLFPRQMLWQSHLMSIVVVTLLATGFTVLFQKSRHAQLDHSRELSEQLQRREEYDRALAERATDRVAIVDARVAERTAELQDTEDALRRLIGKILQLQDAERQRIAHDLHEETAQNVTAMTMAIARLQQMEPELDPAARTLVSEGLSCAEQALKEIRMLSYMLYPPLLDELGLRPALEWYVDEFVHRSRLRVDLTIAATIGRLLPDTETAIFRIVQEALSNVLRHSGSSTVTIQLTRAQDEIVLRVQDQGTGLPSSAMTHPDDAGDSSGVGIPGMRERLRRLGGELDISSSPFGTTLTATLPYVEKADQQPADRRETESTYGEPPQPTSLRGHPESDSRRTAHTTS